MSTWRYVAVPLGGDASDDRRRGEMSGSSATDVRASLRRIGWQVVHLEPVRQQAIIRLGILSDRWSAHLRRRRQLLRCDLCDSLATMLESGVPVLEAVSTLLSADRSKRSAMRTMLTEIRDGLQGGQSFAETARDQPAWFDAAQVAMITAGQQRGELAAVLRSLARQVARGEALSRKLSGALAYPTVVAIVGTAVAMFLSIKTLPELTSIILEAGLEVPALSAWVMGIGQFVLGNWFWLGMFAAVLAAGAIVGPSILDQYQITLPPWMRRLRPAVLRRMGLATLSLRLTELVRTGIPVADALRIAAPTLPQRSLQRAAEEAAERIERGHDVASALADDDWFDAEYRRLVDIGQASGELDTILERLGHRYERQAERLIDRLASLLEPAVILALAVVVGIVVMSAILPLLRLQEILK